MARWEPGSRERLQQAALDLYREQGFEQTTVAEIARRVGITKRTFFRHFADKREVLFAGAEDLQALLVGAITAAPPDLAPLDAIAAALTAVGAQSMPPRAALRQRQAVIEASAELMERELFKLETLMTAFAGALRGRGVPDPTANLAAQAGMTIFRTAYERWIHAPDKDDMARIVTRVVAELRSATTARS